MKSILAAFILFSGLSSCTNDSNPGGADSSYYSEPTHENSNASAHRSTMHTTDSSVATHSTDNTSTGSDASAMSSGNNGSSSDSSAASPTKSSH